MPSVEERLASLEARMDRMDDLHTLIAGLRGDMTREFTEVRGDMTRQFTELRGDMNRQFDLLRSDVDRRFEQVERRFEQVERHFTWIVGIQAALMLAVIGAMAGAYYR